MSIHFLAFIVINLYFIWWLIALARKKRQKQRKKRPFIEVINETPEVPEPELPKSKDDEWLKRVRAEIEDMTE